jgi:hypothetical protein
MQAGDVVLRIPRRAMLTTDSALSTPVLRCVRWERGHSSSLSPTPISNSTLQLHSQPHTPSPPPPPPVPPSPPVGSWLATPLLGPHPLSCSPCTCCWRSWVALARRLGPRPHSSWYAHCAVELSGHGHSPMATHPHTSAGRAPAATGRVQCPAITHTTRILQVAFIAFPSETLSISSCNDRQAIEVCMHSAFAYVLPGCSALLCFALLSSHFHINPTRSLQQFCMITQFLRSFPTVTV